MFDNLCRLGDCSLEEAIKQLDQGGVGALFILQPDGTLIGLLTDGDVRRAILDGVSLDTSVYSIMNKNFAFWPAEEDRYAGLQKLRRIRRRHMPVVDSQRKLIDVLLLEDFKPPEMDNWVILMAGGLGSRLRPLTRDCPKPLLKVGEKPLLETMIQKFGESGFRKIFLSVNYKSKMIEEYFRDGSDWNVEIEYLKETKPLGTVGALRLLPEKPRFPFFVMNGDVLTRIDFKQLIKFHEKNHVMATMCAKQYDLEVPYGVINLNERHIASIEEKPIQSFLVNAGIYVLSPEVIDLIPDRRAFDMTDLFKKMIAEKKATAAFPILEYWVDIGHIDDFNRANGEYKSNFE